MFKRISAFVISLLTAVCAFSCQKQSSDSTPDNTAGTMEVTFLDVGKADSIIITEDDCAVVIDCGEKGDGKRIVSLLEEKNISQIDCLIITHYDKDHVGGASKVIKSFDVKRVLAPDYSEESEEMDKYLSALNEKNITPELLTEDTSFTLGSVDYFVDAPNKTDYGADNDNDFSLVTKAVHGGNTLLFTGDAMEQRLDEIMDIGSCTLLKVPYHGRKLDNLGQFLEKTSPKIAVVCTSEDEFAGNTKKLLANGGITTYATCTNGDITAVSDGNDISITTEK